MRKSFDPEWRQTYVAWLNREFGALDQAHPGAGMAAVETLFVDVRLAPGRAPTGAGYMGPEPSPRFREYNAQAEDGAGTEVRRSQSFLLEPELLQAHRCIVLLGNPGSGKSTLLRRLTWRLAQTDKLWLPVYVPLRDARRTMAETTTPASLPDLLMPYLSLYQADSTFPVAELADLLRQGQIAVLLDGLDEISSAAARDRWLVALAEWANDSGGTPLVVSSREAGYGSKALPEPPFAHFTLQPLNPAGSRELVEKWFRFTAQTRKLSADWADRQARRLMILLTGQPGLRRVLENPLMLRIAADAYQGDRLPRRSHLYRLYMKDLLKAVSVRRGTTQMSHDFRASEDEAQLTAYLQALADILHRRGSSLPMADLAAALDRHPAVQKWSFSRDETIALAEELASQIGLLRIEGGEVSFAHQTYQEFFVAWRLYEEWRSCPLRVQRRLLDQVDNPVWQEPILLWLGLLDREIAWPMARRELTRRPAWAVRCIQEGMGYAYEELRPSWRAQVYRSLWRCGRWAWAGERSWWFFLRLLALSLLSSRRADQLKQRGAEALEALGQLQVDDAIWDLLDVTSDLSQPGDKERGDISRYFGRVLSHMKPTDVIPPLLEFVENEEVLPEWRDWAEWVIQSVHGPGAVETLGELLPRESIRARAAFGLSKMADDPQARQLVEAEVASDRSVEPLFWALEAVGSPAAVPRMMEAVRRGTESDWYIYRLINFLSFLPIEDACRYTRELVVLPLVQANLRDTFGDVTEPAYVRVRARTLLRLALDVEPQMRAAARAALDWVHRDRVQALPADDEPLLLELMTDTREPGTISPSEVADWAADVTGAVPWTADFCQVLWRRLLDPARPGHFTALRALKHARQAPVPEQQRFVLALVSRMVQPDPPVYMIVEALAALQAHEALFLLESHIRGRPDEVQMMHRPLVQLCALSQASPLRAAVARQSETIRNRFEEVVTLRGQPDALERLIALLDSEDIWAARAAAHVLGEMQAVTALRPIGDWLRRRIRKYTDPENAYLDICAGGGAASNMLRPQMIEALLRSLYSDDGYHRSEAVLAVLALEQYQHTGRLLELLKDDETSVSRAAAYVLGQMASQNHLHEPAAVPGIVEWFQTMRQPFYDADIPLAGKALGAMPAETVRPALLALLNSERQTDRHLALYGLGELRDPAAVSMLLARLDVRHLAREGGSGLDDWDEEAIFAAVALGKIGLPKLAEAVKTLSAAQREDRRFYRAIQVSANHPNPALYLYERICLERAALLQRRLALLLTGYEQDKPLVYLERLSDRRDEQLSRVVFGWHQYVAAENCYTAVLRNHFGLAVET